MQRKPDCRQKIVREACRNPEIKEDQDPGSGGGQGPQREEDLDLGRGTETS